MTRMGWVAAGAIVAAGLGWACSSTPTSTNNCGSGSPPSLVGSYTLSQYTFGSNVYTPPNASGALAFTSFRYSETLTLPTSTLDTMIVDSGTYVIVGSECINETSEVPGHRDFAGTVRMTTVQNVTTLTLSGNDSLNLIIGVWKKQ